MLVSRGLIFGEGLYIGIYGIYRAGFECKLMEESGTLYDLVMKSEL